MIDSGQSRAVLRVMQTEALTLERAPQLESDFVLSPYVWKDGGGFEMLVRVVNHDVDATKKVARIYRARSDDGLRFRMDDTPAIAPSPNSDDDGGCEDPTVMRDGDRYVVLYSGYGTKMASSTLLRADGTRLDALEKRGAVFPDRAYANAKETSLLVSSDQVMHMYFEYSRDEASRIGVAEASNLDGPWTYRPDPIERRVGSWDDWHLSPGPVISLPSGAPLMFYNGATRNAHWRIGYVVFDANGERIVSRLPEPLVVPDDVQDDATDIAFAASALECDGNVWLYYSISDRELMRATLCFT